MEYIGIVLISTIRIYEFLLFIRVVMSWMSVFGFNVYSSKIYGILYTITEPALNLIRRYIPSFIGFFDLSVLWLFLILEILTVIIARIFGIPFATVF